MARCCKATQTHLILPDPPQKRKKLIFRYKPLTRIRTEYKEVWAVIKSVFLSLPPKQTLAGRSGISIVSIFLPAEL
jgi:hypothetical protein